MSHTQQEAQPTVAVLCPGASGRGGMGRVDSATVGPGSLLSVLLRPHLEEKQTHVLSPPPPPPPPLFPGTNSPNRQHTHTHELSLSLSFSLSLFLLLSLSRSLLLCFSLSPHVCFSLLTQSAHSITHTHTHTHTHTASHLHLRVSPELFDWSPMKDAQLSR